MKNYVIIISLIFCSLSAVAQESRVTLSGGYAFANIEDASESTDGWRINGTYEFNPYEGKMAHGISIGYIATTGTGSAGIDGTAEYELNSTPIYYAPKYTFGEGKFKGFVKGAIGMHFSNYKRTGTILEVKDKGAGFYGGVGIGAMFLINESIFLNIEYEGAYLSNSYYRSGFMNSTMLGVGFKF